jgi:hypothetical protein
MTISRRRRNNKQTPFYAFKEGRVYAANRKARRIARSKKVVVLEGDNGLTNTQSAATLNQGEANANDDIQGV